MTHRKTVAALLALGLTAASAQAVAEGGHSKAIDYRNSIMSILKWNMGPMGAMVKGEVPYDEAAFARHAADLNAAAHLDLLSGFPEGSDQGDDTGARIDIWLDWEGFRNKHESFKTATAELAETAKTGDLNAIKGKFGAVGKGCKSCHDAFKD